MEEQRKLRLLEYFDGKPEEFSIYQCLESKILVRFPEAEVKVQKSQIAFAKGKLSIR